ncbi:hypothetical protein BGZ73_006437 [Actinomortierella ambigua]|nr:hypothetical protein BGZ73_006437 [Actinomortierella ambigua]
MRELYRAERTCRAWYSQLIPAAKYTKIITGACRLTLLTHVWLEADSDDDDDEGGEMDSDEQASKSICTEMYGYGDYDDDVDDTDDNRFETDDLASTTRGASSAHLPSSASVLDSAPLPRSSISCRPLCHATTALTEICKNDDGDHRGTMQLHGNEQTTGAGVEIENSSVEGHPTPVVYTPPSISSPKHLTPTCLPIPADATNHSSRNFDHRQMDEIVQYFSKTRTHKCNRRPIGQCWRAGDAGQSLSNYEVVVVGGLMAKEGSQSESDHDGDEGYDDDSDESDGIDQSNRDSSGDSRSEQYAQRRHAHVVFPTAPSSSQQPMPSLSHQLPLCCLDVSRDTARPCISRIPERPLHRASGSRKVKRVRCLDAQEPQALLVYTSEDVPQEGYDPETHVPLLDPQKDQLTYDADLTWRDAQKVSEIWVYITSSFIASGYYGPKMPILSDHAECLPCGKSPPHLDQQGIRQIRQKHQLPYQRQQQQQTQKQTPSQQDQAAYLTATSSLHPALQGLRQRYDICRQKSMECTSRFRLRMRSSSPPSSLPLQSSTTSPSYSPCINKGSPFTSPLSLPTTLLPPPPAQQTLHRVAVINEFRERIALLQKIVEEEQLPWYPHYLNDMRVVRWVASRDTCLPRDDAITDRENAISVIQRLVKQQQEQQAHQGVGRLAAHL